MVFLDNITLETNRLFARLQFDARRRLRLYREYTGLLKSGLSRSEALDILWKIASRDGQRPLESIAIILADARNGIRNGLSLAESLRSWIPREDYMLIKAIDGSDRFADYLEAWCQTIEARIKSQTNAIGSLFYPALLVIIAYGLLVYFDLKIIPSLAAIFPQNRWNGTAALFQIICSAATNYVFVVALLTTFIPVGLIIILPRWVSRSRDWADRLPLFALYRAYCGLSYLQALAALMSGGLNASEAILRLREGASPYFCARLDQIRFNILNGRELGQSMQLVANGWPDIELALSMQALSHIPDFPAQIIRMAIDWRMAIEQRTERAVAIWRMVAFLMIFAVVSGIVSAMYEIQSQIAFNVR